MSWSPWPAKLEVFGKVFYRDSVLEHPDIHWYEAQVEIAITPWIAVNIHNFYVELTISGRREPTKLSEASVDDQGYYRTVEISRGYRLEPTRPIGPKQLIFQFSAIGHEVVSTNAFVVLEAGIRKGKFAIRKSIQLRELK